MHRCPQEAVRKDARGHRLLHGPGDGQAAGPVDALLEDRVFTHSSSCCMRSRLVDRSGDRANSRLASWTKEHGGRGQGRGKERMRRRRKMITKCMRAKGKRGRMRRWSPRRLPSGLSCTGSA